MVLFVVKIYDSLNRSGSFRQVGKRITADIKMEYLGVQKRDSLSDSGGSNSL